MEVASRLSNILVASCLTRFFDEDNEKGTSIITTNKNRRLSPFNISISGGTTISGKKEKLNETAITITSSEVVSSAPMNDKNNNSEIIEKEMEEDDEDNEDSGSSDDENDNNKDSLKRATVIYRKIDPKQLKNTGLDIQIAQILHLKILEKKQQQKNCNQKEQEIMKKHNDEKGTSIITTNKNRRLSPFNISLSGGTTISEQKPQVQISSRALSVPKITITSPPCDTSTSMDSSPKILRENKFERLEDVKRILNRQILSRKFASNSSSTGETSLGGLTSQSKITTASPSLPTITTLQIPSQTTIKTLKKVEFPPTTNTTLTSSVDITANVSPIIAVRKFHTIASPDVIMKTQCSQTLQKSQPLQRLKQQQSQPQISQNTISGGTINFTPNTSGMILKEKSLSSAISKSSIQSVTQSQSIGGISTNLKTEQNSILETNIFPVTVYGQASPSKQYQTQPQCQPQLSNLRTGIKYSKAIIRPIKLQTSVNQLITVRPITALNNSTTVLNESEKSSLEISSLNTPTTHSHGTISNISISKPKILEIRSPTQLEQSMYEELRIKKPNMKKVDLESKKQSLSQSSKKAPKVTESLGMLSKNDSLNIKSEFMSDVDSATQTKVPDSINEILNKRHLSIISESEKEKATAIKEVYKEESIKNLKSSSSSLQTENVPIVLENKLLKPGEQIDLKGLLSKSNDAILEKSIVLSKGTGQPTKPMNSNKMHIIISNEKLKSVNTDMTSLAKEVLQRVTKAPQTKTVTLTPNLVLTNLAKIAEKNVEYPSENTAAPSKKVHSSSQAKNILDKKSSNESLTQEKTFTMDSATLPTKNIFESDVIKSDFSSSEEDTSNLKKSTKRPISEEIQYRKNNNKTTENKTLKGTSTILSAKQMKKVALFKENHIQTPKICSADLKNSTVPQRSHEISKASMLRNDKKYIQPNRQKARLREKVLAFCGIEDRAQVSPVKEYPKTVEIVEEEDIPNEDISTPTAVDFIASLLMLNCTDAIADEETKTDDVQLVDKVFLNNKIQKCEVSSELSPLKSNNKLENRSEKQPQSDASIVKVNKNIKRDVVVDTVKTSGMIGNNTNDNSVKKQEQLQIFSNFAKNEHGGEVESAPNSENSISMPIKNNIDEMNLNEILKNEQEKTSAYKVINSLIESSKLDVNINLKTMILKDSELNALKDNDLKMSDQYRKDSEDCKNNSNTHLKKCQTIKKKSQEQASLSDKLKKDTDNDNWTKPSESIELSGLELIVNERKFNLAGKVSTYSSSKQSKILNENFQKDDSTSLKCFSNTSKDDTIKEKCNSSNKLYEEYVDNNSLKILNRTESINEVSNVVAETSSTKISMEKNFLEQLKEQPKSEKYSAQLSKTSAGTTTRKRIGFRNARINLVARKNHALKKSAHYELSLNVAKDIVSESQKGDNVEDLEILNKNESYSESGNIEKIVENPREDDLRTETKPDSSVFLGQQLEILTKLQSTFECKNETVDSKKIPSTVEYVSNESDHFSNAVFSTEFTTPQANINNLLDNTKLKSKNESENHMKIITECFESETENDNLSKKGTDVEMVAPKVQNFEGHDIQIVATVPFSDESNSSSNIVKKTLSSTEQQNQKTVLPEVGSIIDMKAYGLNQRHQKIIVLQNEGDSKNQELDENSSKNVGESVIVKNVFDTDRPRQSNKDSDSQSSHTNDINNCSDRDSPISIIGRKRRKRLTLLSSSGSENAADDEDKMCPFSSTGLTSILYNEISSTSGSSELFGFSEQSQTITSTTDQKRQTKNENLIDTMRNFDILKISEVKYSSPFVPIGSKHNVPLKKRWELSKHSSREETDITDDTSPAADDDTMDYDDVKNKIFMKSNSNDDNGHDFDDTLESSNDQTTLEIIKTKPSGNRIKKINMKTCPETIYSRKRNKSIEPMETDNSSQGIESETVVEKDLTSLEKHHPIDNSEKTCSKVITSKTPVKRTSRPKKMKKDSNISINSVEINYDLNDTDAMCKMSSPIALAQKKRGRKLRLNAESIQKSSQLQIDDENIRSEGHKFLKNEIKTEPGSQLSLQLECNTESLTSPISVNKKYSCNPDMSILTAESDRIFSENQQQKKIDKRQFTEDNINKNTKPTPKKRGRKPKPVQINTSQGLQVKTSKIETEKEEADLTIEKTRGQAATLDKTTDFEQTKCYESKDFVPSLRKNTRLKPHSPEPVGLNQTGDTINKELSIIDAKMESSMCTPKRRGKKSHVDMIANENQGSSNLEAIQNNHPPKQPLDNQTSNLSEHKNRGRKRKFEEVEDFNPRLLLIRERDQLYTEDILTVPDSEPEKGPLQCGLCLQRTTQSKWHKHLGEHYGVGWIVGKEPAINIKLRSKVLSTMTTYFKQRETNLLCRICARSYRSGLGLLLHLETCGDTTRIECPICGNQYSKLSYTVHQRTCEKMEREKSDDNVEDKEANNTIEPVLNSSGRLKRASLMKAETKLKKLTREIFENETAFKPKELIKFFSNTTEDQDEKRTFYCTICGESVSKRFQNEADAIKHVVQNHKPKQQKEKDFDGDGSEFEENDEDSEESSVDNDISNSENETERDSDSDNNNDKKVSKKGSKKKTSKLLNKELFDSKRLCNFRTVYSRRCSDVQKVVLNKWKQFIRIHCSDEILYPYATPIYGDNSQRVLNTKDMDMESMNFTFSMKNRPYKIIGESASLEWKNLRRFQSIDQRPTDKLIFLAGPIKTLAWVPLPETVEEQYLVVNCRKNLASFTRYKKPKNEETLLIVYKISNGADTNTNKNATKRNVQAEIYYVIFIPNGPVHTMAFLPSGGYDITTNRLGLLALGTASSNISVFAIPLVPEKFEEMKIESSKQTAKVVSLNPVFELLLDANPDTNMNSHSTTATQCVHICWSEFSGHQHIFASYVNSFIAVWDIKESEAQFSNLNCHIRNERRCFTPLNYFYFGEKVFKSFAIHYDTIGPRWLAVQGCVRKLIVYDIRNLSYPVPVKEEYLKNVPRDIEWSPIWETFVTVFCDAIPNHGSSAIAFNPVGINFTHSKMDSMICGVSTLHYNPWLSIYCIGVDNGDLIYINMRELNSDQQVLARAKRNVFALSALDIKRLDNVNLINAQSKTNVPDNWQMKENDYKEKYGLVFSDITKITADERNAYLSDKRTPPANVERYIRINILRWNLNQLGRRYIAIGYENGILRLIRFNREHFFD